MSARQHGTVCGGRVWSRRGRAQGASHEHQAWFDDLMTGGLGQFAFAVFPMMQVEHEQNADNSIDDDGHNRDNPRMMIAGLNPERCGEGSDKIAPVVYTVPTKENRPRFKNLGGNESQNCAAYAAPQHITSFSHALLPRLLLTAHGIGFAS